MNLPLFLFRVLFVRRTGRAAGAYILVLALLTGFPAGLSASPLMESGNEPFFPTLASPHAQDVAAGEPDGATAVRPGLRGQVGDVPFTTDYADTALSDTEAIPAGELPVVEAGAGKERAPDWDGIWRDTAILAGAQVGAAAVLFALPESVSKWTSEDKKSTFRDYADNFTKPGFDRDEFYINYVLHPYWGATYYIRGRERGLDQASSFVFSTLISAMYEFGVECFFEKPSIQDLIVTPVVGSLVGAYLFEPWRESIKSKQELCWYDHVALVVTDPIGVLSLGVEKLLGLKTTVSVRYPVPKSVAGSQDRVSANNKQVGIAMKFLFN